jgi:PBP1b-binding outer membrane lipoprotein LpoB
MRNFYFRSSLLVIAFMLLSGCATIDYSFVNPGAKVAAAKKVAIFPFAAAVDPYASWRISSVPAEEAVSMVNDIFIREFSRRTRYEIIPPVKVTESLALDKEKLEWVNRSFLGDIYERSSLSFDRLKKLGSQLGVEAILVGKVTDFGHYQNNGSLWTGVGLNLKMVDVNTGEILWEARDKIKDTSITTHSFSAIESKVASYPIVSGGTAKEPKYKTGQGYFYGKSGEFPYHISYEKSTQKLCRNIISTLPRY